MCSNEGMPRSDATLVLRSLPQRVLQRVRPTTVLTLTPISSFYRDRPGHGNSLVSYYLAAAHKGLPLLEGQDDKSHRNEKGNGPEN